MFQWTLGLTFILKFGNGSREGITVPHKRRSRIVIKTIAGGKYACHFTRYLVFRISSGFVFRELLIFAQKFM